jgi:inorganic pyrophosphatase
MLGIHARRLLIRNHYSKIIVGESPQEKIYLKIKNDLKSFWHDVPLNEGPGVFNMVIEIPASSKLKLEMSTKEQLNPLISKPSKKITKQPEFPVRERDYSKDPICNYGFFPQTYSSKETKYRNLYKGDGDPLDVVEMGGPFNQKAGDIIQVKLLGCFCLIDQGEVDWKIVVANIKSLHENKSLEESIKHMMHWFKIFKTFEGKKENFLLDDEKFFNLKETNEVIESSHKEYNILNSNRL